MTLHADTSRALRPTIVCRCQVVETTVTAALLSQRFWVTTKLAQADVIAAPERYE